MLSAVSYQNRPAVSFGIRNPIGNRHDLNALIRYVANRTNAAAGIEKTSLVNAFDIACDESSRLKHLPRKTKFRGVGIGKMKPDA